VRAFLGYIRYCFDKEFKDISKKISLYELYSYLNKDMSKLSVEELVKINSNCHQFFLISSNFFPKNYKR